MSSLPLFYTSVVAVSRHNHAAHRIAPSAKPFGFAANAHLVPAVIDEFATAALHLPVLFAPTKQGFAPVFLCGSVPGRNHFIDADGGWHAGYLPAYLRRYPFILGEQNDTNTIVCVDAAFDGLVETGAGERLFDDEGNKTAFMEQAIKLITDYAIAAKRTEAAMKMIADLNLFRKVNVESRDPAGSIEASMSGLSVIDETALNALSDEDYLTLRRAGLLGVMHAHLVSLGNLSKVQARKVAEAA